MKFYLIIENDPDKIRSLLQEILNRPEFSGLRPDGFQAMLNRVFEILRSWRVYRVFAELLRSFTELIARAFIDPVTGGALKALILVLVGIFLILVISVILKRISFNASQTSDQQENVFNTDPRYYEKEAEEFAKKGEFVEALRHLYLSLLLFFSAKGILDFSHSRTNREIEKLVSRLNGTSFIDKFSNMNSIFEEKVYALKPCTTEEFEKFRQLYHQCRRGAASIE
jgi:hypothetical protein